LLTSAAVISSMASRGCLPSSTTSAVISFVIDAIGATSSACRSNTTLFSRSMTSTALERTSGPAGAAASASCAGGPAMAKAAASTRNGRRKNRLKGLMAAARRWVRYVPQP
jgi:hypothetical protein